MNEPNDLSPESFRGHPTFDLHTDLIKSLGAGGGDFKVLMDLLPISLMVIRGGMIIYANPSLLHLLGYEKAEEFIGQSPLSIFPFEEHARIRERLNKLVEEGSLYNSPIELTAIKRNGDKIYIEGESIAVIHQGIPAVMIFFHDIGQRKLAQESLRRSEENFKAMIQQMPDGVLIDQPKEILFVNQSLIKMLGYEKEEEFVGRSPFDFIAPRFHASIRERIVNIYGQGGHNPNLEYEWIKKDGTPLVAEGSSISIVYEGKEAVLAVVRDITLRKSAEAAQRSSESSFQTIIQKMPEGVAIVDQGKVLFVNPSLMALLGFADAEEMKGRPMLDFIHPAYHSQLRERFARAAGGEVNPVMVYEMVAKDGKRVDVESSSFSIQFNGQQAFIVVVRNRTHQNLVERQLIDNEKLATLGTLTAGIAHEINNPLGIILGNLVFLIENYDALKSQMEAKGFTDDQCGKLFSEIGEELADTTHGGETIRDIVRGLKSFSRSSVEEVAEVDLNQIVESAIHMTLYEFKYKAKLVRGLAEGLPLLAINPGKLQQVLVNLLINASQSFENNKSEANVITVRTGLKEGSLFVEITDTGKGIPDDVLAHIFEPFYTTKPAGMGTGLGLPICREIVRCFQGTLEVQTQVGKGTTFTVRLPLKNGLTAHSADPG